MAILTLLASSRGNAQQADATAFRIFEQQEIDLGDRSIIYNRVQTPVLKPEPMPGADPVLNQSASGKLEAAWLPGAQPDGTFFLSATAYDHQVSEIRWFRENGEYLVWSSIDFNQLRGTFPIRGRRQALRLAARFGQ